MTEEEKATRFLILELWRKAKKPKNKDKQITQTLGVGNVTLLGGARITEDFIAIRVHRVTNKGTLTP